MYNIEQLRMFVEAVELGSFSASAKKIGKVQSIGNNEENIIKLAFDDALLTPSLSHILNEFSQHFPTTEIELISALSPDVIPLIIQKRADIGLMFTSLSFYPDVETCFIGSLPFISVCNPDHILVQTEGVSTIDLVSHRQLMVRGYKEESIEQFPVMSGKVWWSNSFSSIKEILLHNNLGWTYLPSHIVQDEINNNRLAKIKFLLTTKLGALPLI